MHKSNILLFMKMCVFSRIICNDPICVWHK